jgi:hypothetical protein
MFSLILAEMPEQYRAANAPPPRGVAGRNKVLVLFSVMVLTLFSSVSARILCHQGHI